MAFLRYAYSLWGPGEGVLILILLCIKQNQPSSCRNLTPLATCIAVCVTRLKEFPEKSFWSRKTSSLSNELVSKLQLKGRNEKTSQLNIKHNGPLQIPLKSTMLGQAAHFSIICASFTSLFDAFAPFAKVFFITMSSPRNVPLNREL